MTDRVYKDFGLCCGIGGMPLGLAQSSAEYRGVRASFQCIGGIDYDAIACRDFKRLVGVEASCIDLFSTQQMLDYNELSDVPDGWVEAQPEDIFRAAGSQYPNIVTTSSPCKALSGLLSNEKAASKKYQALADLTVRSIWLTLLAFEADLPEIIFFENVPRIQSERGAHLLKQISGLMESYGYAIHMGVHDAGEIGGLGQKRPRFFIMGRNTAKVKSFIYKPVNRGLKSIGSVIGRLPPVGDTANGGDMHRLPRMSNSTALRLAVIHSGGDWRDLLNDMSGVNVWRDESMNCYRLSRFTTPDTIDEVLTNMVRTEMPMGCKPRGGVLKVMDYKRHSDCITASGDIWASSNAVADKRGMTEYRQDGIPYILSEDTPGQWSWHRPLTTYECAALQDLPVRFTDGTPLVLEGTDRDRREHIGNCVPPGAMSQIGNVMLQSMLRGSTSEFRLSPDEIWVNDDRMIDLREGVYQ